MYTSFFVRVASIPHLDTRSISPDTGDIDAAIFVALILISVFVIFVILKRSRM